MAIASLNMRVHKACGSHKSLVKDFESLATMSCSLDGLLETKGESFDNEVRTKTYRHLGEEEEYGKSSRALA